MSIFGRTEILIGSAAMELLGRAEVIVFGIGGVGGYAAEALVRCGVGGITLVDHDIVGLTNINRQIHAMHSTLGQLKVDAMSARLSDINPMAAVYKISQFYSPGKGDDFFQRPYSYVIDCMDTVACKLDLVAEAHERGIPIISCMGTGNKLDPTGFCISDISKTRDCPLARTMRKELRKRGIRHLTVVYSHERPARPADEGLYADMMQELENGQSSRRAVPGSVSFVPSVAGLLMAAGAVKGIIGQFP